MVDYDWLTIETVIKFHNKILLQTGGSNGIRDADLLESALGKPQNLYAYEDAGIYELAASYAEGIARNHAFIDGNKRTALMTAEHFLERHGIYLRPEKDNEHVEAIEQLAQGLMSREEFARHLETHSQPVTDPLH
jgi:death-on-curing protein